MKSTQIPYQTLTGLAELAGLTWLAGVTVLTGLTGLAELTELTELTGTLLASQISGGCRRSKNLELKKKCRTAATKCTFFLVAGFVAAPWRPNLQKHKVF